MRVFKKLLVGIVALAVLAVTGSGLWLWQGLKTLETPRLSLTSRLCFLSSPARRLVALRGSWLRKDLWMIRSGCGFTGA